MKPCGLDIVGLIWNAVKWVLMWDPGYVEAVRRSFAQLLSFVGTQVGRQAFAVEGAVLHSDSLQFSTWLAPACPGAHWCRRCETEKAIGDALCTSIKITQHAALLNFAHAALLLYVCCTYCHYNFALLSSIACQLWRMPRLLCGVLLCCGWM